MTKEEHAKVLAALEAITKHFSISRLHESTLADTTVRGQAHEAIAIMRKEPQGWLPIETAPKDMFSYLFLCNGVALQGFRDATDALFVCQEDGRHRWRLMRRKPTHWMPLPTPPGKEPPQISDAEKWKQAVMLAYGHLWHVNNEPMAPIPMRSPEKAAYAARRVLLDLLTHEERGLAINEVRALLEKAR